MPQIKHLSTSTVITVAQTPNWLNGVWECGDQRFTDASGSDYEPVPEPVNYPLLTPGQFYTAITTQEWIAIKALTTDPVVVEFLARFQFLSSQPGAMIDPNSGTLQSDLAHMATATTATPPGAGILAPVRVPQILVGVMQ
jgi:hypothetical protein